MPWQKAHLLEELESTSSLLDPLLEEADGLVVESMRSSSSGRVMHSGLLLLGDVVRAVDRVAIERADDLAADRIDLFIASISSPKNSTRMRSSLHSGRSRRRRRDPKCRVKVHVVSWY